MLLCRKYFPAKLVPELTEARTDARSAALVIKNGSDAVPVPSNPDALREIPVNMAVTAVHNKTAVNSKIKFRLLFFIFVYFTRK